MSDKNTMVLEKQNKAQKLLGLDGKETAPSALCVQLQGHLQLRDASAGPMGLWKKRFGVIKDGFFIWYGSPPTGSSHATCNFDKSSKGVFPLNGAYVKLCEGNDSLTQIELLHPDLPKSTFILKLVNEVEAKDWFQNLEKAKAATWDNALLGIAMLEKIEAEGTKLEAEKKAAVEELQRKAGKLRKANDAKIKLVEKQKKQMESLQNQLSKKEEEARVRETKKIELEKEIREEERDLKESERETKELETRLNIANMALRRLEDALMVHFKEKEVAPSPARSQSGRAKQAAEVYHSALQESSASLRSGKIIQKRSTFGKKPRNRTSSARSRECSTMVDISDPVIQEVMTSSQKQSGLPQERLKRKKSKLRRQAESIGMQKSPPPPPVSGVAPGVPPRFAADARAQVTKSVQALREVFDGIAVRHRQAMAFWDNANIRSRLMSDEVYEEDNQENSDTESLI